MHWSLAVVVNPGAIVDHTKRISGDLEHDESAPCPSILFADSLKCHRKTQVGILLRKWLNSEWQRLRNKDEQPFTAESMRILSPRGTCAQNREPGDSLIQNLQCPIRLTAMTAVCTSVATHTA